MIKKKKMRVERVFLCQIIGMEKKSFGSSSLMRVYYMDWNPDRNPIGFYGFWKSRSKPGQPGLRQNRTLANLDTGQEVRFPQFFFLLQSRISILGPLAMKRRTNYREIHEISVPFCQLQNNRNEGNSALDYYTHNIL